MKTVSSLFGRVMRSALSRCSASARGARFFAALALVAFTLPASGQQYLWTTLAGGGPDGTGFAAQFDSPFGIAADASGNLYVADTSNHSIRKVTPSGVTTTLAGSAGNPGSLDGTGSAAQFVYPIGLAVDGNGNVYVADLGNHNIRKVTAAGVVTTLAGSAGNPGYANGLGTAALFDDPTGIAVDSSGNVYVADSDNSVIRAITPAGLVSTLAGTAGVFGSANGLGPAAQFNGPSGLALNGSNLYVSDYGNETIRVVTLTGSVTTLAGSIGNPGSANGMGVAAQFNRPLGLAVDATGNIYVADKGSSTIRMVTAAGLVSTFAGLAGNQGNAEGTGAAASFQNPSGVAVAAGNVYVADTDNDVIRLITPAGAVSTFVGAVQGPRFGAAGEVVNQGNSLNSVGGIVVDPAGNIYIADSYRDCILKVLPTGETFTLAGSSNGAQASVDGTGSAAEFNNPTGITLDPSGNLYVVDNQSSVIRMVTPAGVVTTIAGSPGSQGSNDGTGPAAQFSNPTGIVYAAGNLYVTDTNNGTIRMVTTAGAVTTIAGMAGNSGFNDGSGSTAQFSFPSGITVGAGGNLYVVDANNGRIRQVTTGGTVTTLAGSGMTGSMDGLGGAAQFNFENGNGNENAFIGIAADSSGNLYVADASNYTIRMITPGGLVSTLAGTAGNQGTADGTGGAAQFADPSGVAVDSSGNIYVTDLLGLEQNSNSQNSNSPTPYDGLVRLITSAGVVTTLANPGTSADGPGALARFNSPTGLALDGGGNLYVTDAGNDTIRMVTPAGVVTTVAGSPGLGGSANGMGSAARFNLPAGITVDGGGNLYVVDAGNDIIRMVAPGGVVTTLAGSPGLSGDVDATGAAARFTLTISSGHDSNKFASIALQKSSGNLYLADIGNRAIREVTPAGVTTTFLADLGAGGLIVDSGGTFYTINSDDVSKYTPFGLQTPLAPVGAVTDSNGVSSIPCLAVDGQGNLYVTGASLNGSLFKVTPTGVVSTLTGIGALPGAGVAAGTAVPGASGIAVDASGNLYVADYPNNRILKGVPQAGVPVIGLQQPAGVGLLSGVNAVDFGSVTELKTFTITNNGTGNLNLGAISIDGTNASEFAVDSSQTAVTVAPGGSTTFNVTFSPLGAAGSVSAALHVVSNDPVTPSFNLALTAYTFISTQPTISFFTPVVVVHNTNATATLTVQRNFTAPATVSFQTLDGAAIAGTNYLATQGTISFAQGQTLNTVTVPLLNQGLLQSSAAFSVVLSNPSGTVQLGTPAIASVIILNDNSAEIALSSISQTAPPSPPDATASITVNLTPPQADGQWRIFGELAWRNSGAAATGLISANYEVEYKPVAGYQEPGLLTVPLADGEAAVAPGAYQPTTGTPATGSLSVTLVLPNGSGGWRLQGASGYETSGQTISGLNPGSYIVEFEPATGATTPLATPQTREVIVQAGPVTSITSTYLIADSAQGNPPTLVGANAAQSASPYIFMGQIQTDIGFGSGFVPLDRVVVTAAHVVFDDGTMSFETGVRWFFQHETGAFEAPPQIPRGAYLFDGYAAQRAADNSPGISTTASQQLDVAALYFLEEAARGGSSGYLASNSSANSWLTGTADKIIVGYPVEGVDPSTNGQLYATAPPLQTGFTFFTGSLFETTAITSFPGNSGGPLCVQFNDGNYYPAAIYLGGTQETVVRAIDSQVTDLMNRAEVSGNGGANNGGNGVIIVNVGLSGDTAFALGNVNVNLGPPGAVAAGARWELAGEDVPRASGQSDLGVPPGAYTVQFLSVPGYNAPSSTSFTVIADAESDVTGVYTPTIPPTINGRPSATAIMGEEFQYQISATYDPTSYSTSTLPNGLKLNAATGVISGAVSGVPTGLVPVTLHAANGVGASAPATLMLTIAMAGELTVNVQGNGSVPKTYAKPSVQAVGSALSILATPAPGYLFDSWSDSSSQQLLSTQPLYRFTMMDMVNLQVKFVVNPFLKASGSYFGLLQGGSYATSGYLQLAVTTAGSFTAVFSLGAEVAKVVNSFNDQGQYSGEIMLPDGRLYNVSLFLTANGVLTGGLINVSDQSQILLSAGRAAPPPKALVGAFTAGLPLASPDPTLPGGDGFGSISVTPSGAATFTGFLGDGTAVRVLGSLDSHGAFAFYFAKAAGKTSGAQIVLGSLLATMPPTATAPNGFAGTLGWFRQPDAQDPLYPDGFATQIAFAANAYKASTVNYPNDTLTFSGAGFMTPVTKTITISSKDVVGYTGSDPFTMKLNPATGLFTGSFLDASSMKRTFNGAVLQSQQVGYGFFQEPSGATGGVLLQKTP